MHEPRKSQWDRDADYDELKDLYRELEEAKAGFKPEDVPYISGYNAVGARPVVQTDDNGKELPLTAGQLTTPIYKVRRVEKKRRNLDRSAANYQQQLEELNQWEESIINHYKYIQQLARAIAENTYVKRFYPNNVNSWVYLKDGRQPGSEEKDDYLDITATSRVEQFSIERVSHNTQHRTWDIENTYNQLMKDYV